MMRFLVFFAAAPLVNFVSGYSPGLVDPDLNLESACESSYESLSAEDKSKEVWSKILQSSFNTHIPTYADHGLKKGKLLCPYYLSKTFTRSSDEIGKRKKLIYSSGSTIQFSFISSGKHPYSGIFESGAKFGLMRASLAQDATKEGIIPGIALKFFVDGQESLNIMAMESLDPDSLNTNFFNRGFTNLVPTPDSSIKNIVLESSFNKALKQIGSRGIARYLTVRHIAAFHSNGNLVEHDKIKAPYQIFFIPTDDLIALTKDQKFDTDFRTLVEGKGSGIELFKVYGAEKDSAESLVEIGTIHSVSRFLASSYGDEFLFFKHQKDEI